LRHCFFAAEPSDNDEAISPSLISSEQRTKIEIGFNLELRLDIKAVQLSNRIKGELMAVSRCDASCVLYFHIFKIQMSHTSHQLEVDYAARSSCRIAHIMRHMSGDPFCLKKKYISVSV